MILDSPIATERLILRSLTREDASQKYLNWLRDKEITKYLEVRFSPPKNLIELEKYIQDISKNNCDLLLGIFLQDDICTHIGNIKIGPIRPYHSLAEVSIFIGDRSAWGKGYAFESIVMATNFASQHLKLRKLTASMYEDNIGSIRAFSKSGWSIEANLPNHYIVDEQEANIVIMGVRL